MTIDHSEARRLYDSGAPVAHVAGLLGLSDKAFRRFRADHGWPLRPSPIRRQAPASAEQPPAVLAHEPARTDDATGQPAPPPPAALPDPSAGAAEPDIPRFRRKMQGRIHKQMAEIERRFGEPGADVERDARLLASLVKSLAELRRLEALCAPLQQAATATRSGDMNERDDERPARDLATLRDELARALERLEGQGVRG